MESNAIKSNKRLQQLLMCDKNEFSASLCNVVKQDIEKMLQNYISLKPDSLFVNYNLNKNGEYFFNISFEACRVKQAGYIIK